MEGSIITVICWDGKTLASDSRVSSGSEIISDSFIKIHKIDIDYFDDTLLALGLCGDCTLIDKYLSHISSDEFLNKDISHEMGGIVIGHRHVYTISHDTDYLIRFKRDTRLAEGCGSRFARAALELGKSSEEAVKLAIKLSSGCGGRVQTWRMI